MVVLANRTPITVATNYRLADASASTRLIDVPFTEHAEEFVQEIQPPVRLIIFGDYFDAESVAYLGGYLGWQVEVVADADELPDGRSAHRVYRDVSSFRPGYRRSQTGAPGKLWLCGLAGTASTKAVAAEPTD